MPSSSASSRPGTEWELGKVWAEKREIFYEQSKWKPLDNFTYVLLILAPCATR